MNSATSYPKQVRGTGDEVNFCVSFVLNPGAISRKIDLA
ncbi:hypothetical protein EPIR_2299 [Erwinia piriflorinigrans CFBP 5888]|uniref:Uncharacterized protein n=1 Tax=Erwinia piriflorinigrans CFBP 5888 TaxID=1161919 RepID=V5Z8V6_9GAMM|nr:hypothetical protein EPIR_2299 [Erwinia piriflorinigrans CFBP 5888]